jgi:RHS repeat-associated protein
VSGGATTTYTYGSNGELKSKAVSGGGGTTSYTYDALGNLTHVVLPSGATLDYLIDGQNRRVGFKLNGTLKKAWLYQNQLNPVAELDGSGNLVSRFVYGTRANVPDYMVNGGKVYRLVTDHLGSVRMVVDTASGAVAQRIDYDEFGVATIVSGAGFQPFGFAGGLTDSATTLVRFGARDYDPAVGRWTAKDPVEFAGGPTSLYAYGTSDPLNVVDPAGLWEAGIGASGSASAGAFVTGSVQIAVTMDGWDLRTLDVGIVFSATTGPVLSPGIALTGGLVGTLAENVTSFDQVEGATLSAGALFSTPGGNVLGGEVGNIPLSNLSDVVNGRWDHILANNTLLTKTAFGGKSVAAVKGLKGKPELYWGITGTKVFSLMGLIRRLANLLRPC